MQRHRFLFIALGLLTVWRIALLPTSELAPNESVAAFQASHGLHQGWWDQGPAVAWTARLGMSLVGHNELGVRLLVPLFALITSIAVWRLARGLFDPTVAGWAVAILNVLPAFHLASLHLTTGSLLWPLVALLALLIRRGLLQANPIHWSWWAAGLALAAMQYVTSAGIVGLVAAGCALGIPKRRRHHLSGFGFFILLLMWLPAAFHWMMWQNQHEWPIAALGTWQPSWNLIANLFRWVLMASPLLLTFIVLSVRLSWPLATRITPLGFPLGLALPLALIDLFWGALYPWPDASFSIWMLPLILLVAHRAAAHGNVESATRISLRTMMLALAALQSVFISHTDLPRSLGLPWPLETRSRRQPDFPHYLSRDPAGASLGWQHSGDLVAAVLRDAVEAQASEDTRRWFVIAETEQLASGLEFYMPPSVPMFRPAPSHPRVHRLQDGNWENPFAWWPRYDALQDGVQPYAGLHALFVTDSRSNEDLPAAITAHFESTQPISVARIMHGGHEVRTLKIFACYRYQPPEL